MNKRYTEAILGKPVPKALIDICPDTGLSGLKADVVSVENEDSIYRITRKLIESGHRQLGFIGDIASCRSFMERWLGFRRAVIEYGIMPDASHCLTAASPTSYQSYEEAARLLSGLRSLPEAFVCANDLIALSVIRFLRTVGKRVPDDVAVSGFDQSAEAGYLDFTLTTVSNDEFRLGARAAEQLLLRLQHPERPYETVRLANELVWGDSTGQTGGGSEYGDQEILLS